MIDILKALGDETRLRIVSEILNGEMWVCEIEACLHLTQSNASRHLTVLRKAGILDCYKKAQWAYFKMSEQFIAEHRELYDYLLEEIPKLPSYQEDLSNYRRCKEADMCSCKPK